MSVTKTYPCLSLNRIITIEKHTVLVQSYGMSSNEFWMPVLCESTFIDKVHIIFDKNYFLTFFKQF